MTKHSCVLCQYLKQAPRGGDGCTWSVMPGGAAWADGYQLELGGGRFSLQQSHLLLWLRRQGCCMLWGHQGSGEGPIRMVTPRAATTERSLRLGTEPVVI